MANTLLTPSIIAKEALMVLENNLVMGNKVTREYTKEFKKVGSTVTIRKPVKFNAVKATTMSLQDVTENSTTLSLDTQAHVAFQFSSNDLTLVIEEFSDRYIKPAMIAIANQIDTDLCARCVDVHNLVGTPGTTPANFAAIAAATQRLQEEAVPTNDGIIGVVNPKAAWTLANGLSTVYNQAMVSDVIRKGWFGNYALADWYTDQNVNTFTVGALGGTPLVNGASQTGSSLVTDGWTSAAAPRLNKGDVFTIADVYAVNPVSGQSTGSLRQFVCTAAASSDASGNLTASIYPPMIASGPYKTISALPANDAALTVVGTAATAYPQNLVFHPQAFALATAPLAVPDGAVWSANENYNGLSLRIVKAYDITNDVMPCRIDVLYGVKTLYPELAVRLVG